MPRIPRIIFNDDSDILRNVPPPHTIERLSIALDYLKGTQVDCLCWCVGEQQMAYSYASSVWESTFDRMAQHAAAPTAAAAATRDLMYGLHRQGIDYLPHLIRRAQAQGLMFVASFRMNDTHVKSYPDSWLASKFWQTHQHYRLWEATDGKSYYNAALDYSYPEVRNRYRDAVAEVASTYDVDGIELDFTRSPYFFQPSEAWEKREILTDFVRQVRDLIRRIEAGRGRPLTLILRVACPERALTTAGIDLRRWIQERLAQVLIISELVNNYNQTIEPWRTICREAGVLLYPAVEAGPAYNAADFYTPLIRNPQAPRHDGQIPCSLDERIRLMRGAAQNLLAQDPDGIAMFNGPRAESWATPLLSELGSLETLAGKDKRYAFYNDLPIYVEANRPRQFHQTIPFTVRGEDIRRASVTLRWRQIAEKNPHADASYRQNPIVKPGLLKVFLNNREIPEDDLTKTRAPTGRIPSGFRLRSHEIVELTVPGRELRDGENALAFEMPNIPHARDPYVYIYELEADARFG
jgi:hypothetical protein